VLSVALIFLIFPLIWFTSFDRYMMVETESRASTLTIESVDGEGNVGRGDRDVERAVNTGTMVSLKNNLPTAIGGWTIWVLIAAMNVATLTFLGLGIGGD
jgi:metal iron transporter